MSPSRKASAIRGVALSFSPRKSHAFFGPSTLPLIMSIDSLRSALLEDTHLKPRGSGGAKERLLLESGTRAGFAGGKLDVSVMSSGEQNGTVIGIRTGSNWTFYAQRFQMFSTARGTIGSVQVYK